MRGHDLSRYFHNHFHFKNGISSLGKGAKVSFPDDGHEQHFQIEDDSFWYKHRNHCIASVVARYSKDAVFFDVGGGNGKVTKYLQDDNVPVVLVEAGVQGTMNARQRGVTQLIHADFTDLDIKPSSLPAVGMFDVLEHIKDDAGCIKKIYNALIPDGYYYLAVPAYAFLWSHEDVTEGHFRRYTLRSLKKKLQHAGFQIAYATYIFQYLPLPIFLTRVLSSRLPFLKNRNIDDRNNDHISNARENKILEFLNARELSAISKGKSMKFGSTVLIVAKK